MTEGSRKEIYFHLLNAEGTKVEQSIHADQKADEKKFELEKWYSVEGEPCLVHRIAFDSNRVDVFLRRIKKEQIN